ncbi:MAG TPA: hypothetical protein VFI29_20225 [Hanamia sp.]|nr:hypothetical protein [Hanamia sp.]
MKLQINKETRIRDVQKKFTEVYPFLKIEFYKKPHAEKKLSSISDRISSEEVLSKVGNFTKFENINLNKRRTVAEFESEFYKKTGVAIQVSRRAGNIWIETSITDDRTLGMQNKQGKIASSTNVDFLMEEDIGS